MSSSAFTASATPNIMDNEKAAGVSLPLSLVFLPAGYFML